MVRLIDHARIRSDADISQLMSDHECLDAGSIVLVPALSPSNALTFNGN
jgi:hypothetical protein